MSTTYRYPYFLELEHEHGGGVDMIVNVTVAPPEPEIGINHAYVDEVYGEAKGYEVTDLDDEGEFWHWLSMQGPDDNL